MADPLAQRIIVCMKWVALRPEIDPLTGFVVSDERWEGPSLADQAALEIGLQLGASWGVNCEVICVGPAAADTMLRTEPTMLVLCGDWSLDRGSASVPVFLSAELGIDAACGIVSLDDVSAGTLHVERRLDGGRREVLTVTGPAVVSVEGSVARLRRASLSGVLASRAASIVVLTPTAVDWEAAPVRVGPFKPRARILNAPASADPRRRVEQLTGALTTRTPPQRLTLSPDDAATTILDQLRSWGQIPQA